jgi:endoglucanase
MLRPATYSHYDELKQVYDARAGFLLHAEPSVPLWVGKFGTCQTLDCVANTDWFRLFVRYLKEHDLAWSYWALNGTQPSGEGRNTTRSRHSASYRPTTAKSEHRK